MSMSRGDHWLAGGTQSAKYLAMVGVMGGSTLCLEHREGPPPLQAPSLDSFMRRYMGVLWGAHLAPPPIRPHWKQCVARKADVMIWISAHNGANYHVVGNTP